MCDFVRSPPEELFWFLLISTEGNMRMVMVSASEEPMVYNSVLNSIKLSAENQNESQSAEVEKFQLLYFSKSSFSLEWKNTLYDLKPTKTSPSSILSCCRNWEDCLIVINVVLFSYHAWYFSAVIYLRRLFDEWPIRSRLLKPGGWLISF